MKLQKYYVVIAAFTFLITHNLLAWRLSTKNDTDGEVLIRIIYSASGICMKEQNKLIAKGKSVTIDMNKASGSGTACCIDYIYVESHSGKAKGQWYKLTPTRGGGLNMTCANLNVRVFNTVDNKLMATAEIVQ